MNLIYKNICSRFLYCIVTSKGSGQIIHTRHISHCEIKSHRIWPIWRAVPIKIQITEFSDHFATDFYEEINIKHTLLWFSQASYMKIKTLDYIWGALK